MLQDTPRPEAEFPTGAEDPATPLVATNGIPGRFKFAEPVKALLKPGMKTIRQKHRKGLENLVTKFLN